MNSTSGGLINMAIVWGIASATGFVAMAGLMILGGWTLIQALFAAAVIFFVLGAILSWLFLKPLPGPASASGASAPAARAAQTPAASPATPAPAAAPAPTQTAAPEPAPAPAPAAAPASGEGTRPAALDGPREGGADDLKRIKGIGPKLETLCNSLGFYHFDQIASWTEDEVAWVDQNLEGFKGRVTRDDWVAQAKLLAAGGETEFSQKVDKGDVY
jgi:NADH-quinone oxidoreductase subunit E